MEGSEHVECQESRLPYVLLYIYYNQACATLTVNPGHGSQYSISKQTAWTSSGGEKRPGNIPCAFLRGKRAEEIRKTPLSRNNVRNRVLELNIFIGWKIIVPETSSTSETLLPAADILLPFGSGSMDRADIVGKHPVTRTRSGSTDVPKSDTTAETVRSERRESFRT